MTFMETKKWLGWLPLAEWWYNTNYHTSLKCTLFEALYGYNPPLISKIMIPGPDSPITDFFGAEAAYDESKFKENLAQAQARIKRYAN
jgi:hypothetical protein